MSNSGDRYGHACQIKRVVSRRIIGPGKSYGKWCLGSITITPVFCYRVTRWPCSLGRKTPLEDLLKHVRYEGAWLTRLLGNGFTGWFSDDCNRRSGIEPQRHGELQATATR